MLQASEHLPVISGLTRVCVDDLIIIFQILDYNEDESSCSKLRAVVVRDWKANTSPSLLGFWPMEGWGIPVVVSWGQVRFFSPPHKVTTSLGKGLGTSGFKNIVLRLVPNQYNIPAERFWTEAFGAILGLHSVCTQWMFAGLLPWCDAESLVGAGSGGVGRHFNLYE